MIKRFAVLLGAALGVLIFAVCAWAGDDSGSWLGNLVGGALTGGVGSIFGGITGLFGNWLNARAEEKKQARNHSHEESMARIDQEGMKLEADLEIKREQTIAEGVIDAAVASSRPDAIRAADVKSDGVFDLVNTMLTRGWWQRFIGSIAAFQITQAVFVVKMIRPAAFAFFAYLFFAQWQTVGKMAATAKMAPQAAFDYQVFMASYLLSMAASFYYCERNRVKPPASPVGASLAPPPPQAPVAPVTTRGKADRVPEGETQGAAPDDNGPTDGSGTGGH